MKYRKKPIVIDATQWFKNGDHPNDYDGDTQGFSAGAEMPFAPFTSQFIVCGCGGFLLFGLAGLIAYFCGWKLF